MIPADGQWDTLIARRSGHQDEADPVTREPGQGQCRDSGRVASVRIKSPHRPYGVIDLVIPNHAIMVMKPWPAKALRRS